MLHPVVNTVTAMVTGLELCFRRSNKPSKRRLIVSRDWLRMVRIVNTVVVREMHY